MLKKSLLKKIVSLFATGKRKNFGKNISANEALDIQNSYTNASCKESEVPDLPYVEIAKQLNSPQEEISDAALYYLRKIAENSAKNRYKIAELLKSVCQENSLSEKDKQSIMQLVGELKSKL